MASLPVIEVLRIVITHQEHVHDGIAHALAFSVPVIGDAVGVGPGDGLISAERRVGEVHGSPVGFRCACRRWRRRCSRSRCWRRQGCRGTCCDRRCSVPLKKFIQCAPIPAVPAGPPRWRPPDVGGTNWRVLMFMMALSPRCPRQHAVAKGASGVAGGVQQLVMVAVEGLDTLSPALLSMAPRRVPKKPLALAATLLPKVLLVTVSAAPP